MRRLNDWIRYDSHLSSYGSEPIIFLKGLHITGMLKWNAFWQEDSRFLVDRDIECATLSAEIVVYLTLKIKTLSSSVGDDSWRTDTSCNKTKRRQFIGTYLYCCQYRISFRFITSNLSISTLMSQNILREKIFRIVYSSSNIKIGNILIHNKKLWMWFIIINKK